MTTPSPFSVIVLAAGMGTRMRSDTHKVLHPIAGKPMLMHLLDTVDSLGAQERVVVVHGHHTDRLPRHEPILLRRVPAGDPAGRHPRGGVRPPRHMPVGYRGERTSSGAGEAASARKISTALTRLDTSAASSA